MRIVFTGILIIISSLSFAQKTITISRDYPNSVTTEKYSVLEAENSVLHGKYTSKFHGKLFAEGTYQNGLRVGKWQFYNHDGALVQTYNYTNRQLVYNDTTDMNRIHYGKQISYTYSVPIQAIDSVTRPVKIGGFDYSLDILRGDSFKHYPKIPDNKNPYLVTYQVVFTIDRSGLASKVQCITTINGQTNTYDIDFSATEVYHQIFIPARVNNQAVESTITLTQTRQYPFKGKIIRTAL